MFFKVLPYGPYWLNVSWKALFTSEGLPDTFFLTIHRLWGFTWLCCCIWTEPFAIKTAKFIFAKLLLAKSINGQILICMHIFCTLWHYRGICRLVSLWKMCLLHITFLFCWMTCLIWCFKLILIGNSLKQNEKEWSPALISTNRFWVFRRFKLRD